MTRPRLTIRVRLTLLYTGLFAACGAIVVAITYLLVSGLSEIQGATRQTENAEQFLTYCRQTLRVDADPELRLKCDLTYLEGVVAGAAGQREATLSHLLQYSLITLVVVTLLAALAGWIVAGRVLRPVHRITAAARAASEHNLSARVSLTGPRDELRELADTFDDMLGRLQAAFESQRRFIANASHELRTPLTVMRATVDVVLGKRAPTEAELLGMGRDVRVAVDQAEAVVEALLTLARNERGLSVREKVDLATVAEDVLDDVHLGDLRLHVSLRPVATSGDPVLLERLVANLVDNALRYNVPGGDVWLATSASNGRVTLSVTNTGPVVPADRVDALFEPFQRLHDRTTSDGFGLGLAIVSSIAAVHDGAITAAARPAGGLCVTLTIPAAEPAPYEQSSDHAR
ncbi:HAMP domain-containing histidine kinase [Microtetraspora sp. AC03309]|uniref:sensor histidine kinase n=1 Tax=Microtetraspora sp. AC03309 TaxID=2779376 RepID=UPI001E4A0E19|nr:HAMP domain-containing sensor histidine kinase [Microtetraspora sp. AC03309]MCC5580274.1 HAMP domain-containing histidine kinase [Microtetraspora sp. AC03309]